MHYWQSFFPPDVESIEELSDDFEDHKGFYSILGCRKTSSDQCIQAANIRERHAFHEIARSTHHPDKSNKAEDHEKYYVARTKWEKVIEAYAIVGSADNEGDFALRVDYDLDGEKLRYGFAVAFNLVNNDITFKDHAERLREIEQRKNTYEKMSKTCTDRSSKCFLQFAQLQSNTFVALSFSRQ